MTRRISSIQKGKRAELALSKELTKLFGVMARRGQQYQGGSESPDVVFDSRISIECKMVEALNMTKAMEQSIADATPCQIPVVMSKKSRKPWLCTVRLADLPALSRILTEILETTDAKNSCPLDDYRGMSKE